MGRGYKLEEKGSKVQALLKKISGLKALGTQPQGAGLPQLEGLELEGVVYTVVTKAVSDLVNYYTKSETYTKSEVNTMVAAIKQFKIQSEDELPQPPSADTMNILYLVPAEEPKVANEKDEFITVIKDGSYAWERVGSTAIDLSGYVTTEALNTALADYVTSDALSTALSGLHDVKYTEQSLMPEQQAQARDNIGAGTYTKPNTGIPETDLAQSVQTSLEKANTAVQPAALMPITELIPEQATPENKLADKNFVNSSIATNTANYISDNGQPFQSVADLEAYTGPLTNNDYAFVVGTDSAGNTTYTRYKYNATTQTWAAEYVLNNSSFTAEQWAAISSGITALLVQKLSELPTEIVTYVSQTLTDAQKQQARQNIGATAPEIFWAEYGVTTYDEVVNAYNGGKVVVVKRDNGIVYKVDFISNPIKFGGWNALTQHRLELYDNNIWRVSSSSAENTANKSQSIETDRASTAKYPSVKAVFDSLGKWGVISQTQTWTGNYNIGYDYTMSNQVWGLIPQANIDFFSDVGAIFNDTGEDIVRKDPFGGDVTHKAGCFYLVGMGDISYKEMLSIYECRWSVPQTPLNMVPSPHVFESARMRYGLVTFQHNWNSNYNLYMFGYYNGGSPMSVVCLSQTRDEVYIGSARQSFSAPRIKKVYPVLNLNYMTGTGSAYNSFYGAWSNCASLEEVRLKNLKIDLPFGQCPSISLASIAYMVENAANTAAITITLHATAYARCQADTTEYEYNGQTYVGIIAYAAARSITIVSA